jgi:hypothetical protein
VVSSSNNENEEARQATKAERRKRKRPRGDPKRPQMDERRDLAATYEREDELGVNEKSRRLFAGHPPQLDALQSELVNRLRVDGIAQVEFAELFSDDLWARLAEDAAVFTREVEHKIKDERARDPQARVRKGGPGGFIQRRYEKRVELGPDDQWLETAISPRLLDVVNAYLGLWAKLTYCDQWYTVPMPEGAARTASQNWHRDHVDKHLVKAFIYLSDVDPDAGPFEYVLGSAGDGPYAGVWPWVPGEDHYPPADEFKERIPPSAIRTLTGPSGTMFSATRAASTVAASPRRVPAFSGGTTTARLPRSSFPSGDSGPTLLASASYQIRRDSR